jgi:predicted Zn-dependent protease
MKRYLCYGVGLLLAVGVAAAAVDPATASRIAAARDQIAKSPGPDSYTSLALALVKAARATDCADYLKQAEEAVANALRIAPDHFEAQKARVAVRLAEGRYSDALAEAKALNKRVPDDNQLYGYLGDAQMALGDYAAAEKSVQWMIDQRPVNAPGLQRGAQLRDYFGYGEPSLEWWSSALRITSSFDSEERAWILVHMSAVSLRLGKAADAGKSARQALDLVANYPPASDALAASLMGENRAGEAVEVLRQRLSAAPNVRAEFRFAEALAAADKKAEAAAAFERFEKDAGARVSEPDNANRELIEYYATHGRADQAVKLGAEEVERRHDIATLSAYALALMEAGRYHDARIQMDRALAPGIRDAGMSLRAGLIAAKVGK